LLRALKREFGFCCIELCAEVHVEPEQPEMAFVMGGWDTGEFDAKTLASMERYDPSSDKWTARNSFGASVIAGDIYVTGGRRDNGNNRFSSVEKYTPSSDTWSAVAPLAGMRVCHAAVAVGSAMYVLGGDIGEEIGGITASVLKFDSALGSWSDVAPMPKMS
jgi:hypothetical protein